MKSFTFFSLLSILSFSCFAQIQFEDGYFISNDGKKTDCLIKNIDWKNNPNEFLYKVSKDAAVKTGTISDVAEFGIVNISKYQRFDVDVDQSSENLEWLSTSAAPEFKNERLFLKVLVEGKATLYHYESKTVTKYFISTDSIKIEPLIFKSYLISPGKVGENNSFRNQLWNYLKCSTIELSAIEKLLYKKDKLIDIFMLYNNCENATGVNYEIKQKRDFFNLTVRPGINSSNLVIQNGTTASTKSSFENRQGLRFGIEAEFVMGFNKNKWAVVIEPVYQYYKSVDIVKTKKTNIDYRSIEFLTGIRHYFFLNNNSKIFLNGNLIYDFPLNSSISLGNMPYLEIKSRLNAAVGIGYKSNNKYSAEIKYMFNREILSDYVLWHSQYQTISFVLGYTIL